MRISQNITGGAFLAALILGFAGASQAQTVTISAVWDTNPITGSTTGGLATFTGNGSPLSANATQAWDIIADLGVTKTFAFNTPMTATIFDGVGSLENYFKATTVSFTGAGAGTGLFTQIFSMQDTGSNGSFSYLGSNTVQYNSDENGLRYVWSAKFNTQSTVTQAFSAGQTTYAWPDATADVTLVAVIPEPATAALLGLGLAPIAVAIRRRRK